MTRLLLLQPFFALLIIFIGLFSPDPSRSDPSRQIEEITAGDYPEQSKILGPEGYQEHKMYRLKNPTLVWVDSNWLREKNFDVPKAGMTNNFKRRILNVLGFAGKLSHEPAEAYTEEYQKWYSDFYGGTGKGENYGSGRAASKGLVQIKGSGRTTMVSPNQDIYHSNGASILSEGINEVIASQIAHNELPYGANRVIALVATGTYASLDGGNYWEPRILIVREDPIRPAHFIYEKVKINGDREKQRRLNLVMSLADSLPQPEDSSEMRPKEKVAAGTREFIKRLAETQAFSYARGFFHGATSPSNVELSGKSLDFGSFISFRTFAKAWRIKHVGPYGDNRAVKSYQVSEFLYGVRDLLGPHYEEFIPSEREAEKLFDRIYDERLTTEFVHLTGVPEELLIHIPKAQYQRLSNYLLHIAQAGNHAIIDASNEQPEKSGTYNLAEILLRLAQAWESIPRPFPIATTSSVEEHPESFWNRWTEKTKLFIRKFQKGSKEENSSSRLNEAQLRHLMASLPNIADSTLRENLAKEYFNLRVQIESLAASEGIQTQVLNAYFRHATEIRNKRVPELFRGSSFWQKYSPLITKFSKDWDPSEIWKSLDQAILDGKRTDRDAAPYTLVLRERKSKKSERRIREVFDLKTGEIFTQILSEKGQVYTFPEARQNRANRAKSDTFSCKVLMN